MDDVLFTKIRVNEVNTPAAENVAGVEGVTSTLACGIHAGRVKGDVATSRGFTAGEKVFVVTRESQKAR